MGKNRPKKTMTDAELEAVREHWRQVAFRELAPASLRILEIAAANECGVGRCEDANGKENVEDEILLQYQREVEHLRPIAEEVLEVLEVCRGKARKAVSREQFELLLEEARQRGRRRAAPKSSQLSETK